MRRREEVRVFWLC